MDIIAVILAALALATAIFIQTSPSAAAKNLRKWIGNIGSLISKRGSKDIGDQPSTKELEDDQTKPSYTTPSRTFLKEITDPHLYVKVEELTFQYLERKYGKKISKRIRLPEIGGYVAHFDGIIEDEKGVIIFEIIMPQYPHFAWEMFKARSSFFHKANYHALRVKKPVELKVVIVVRHLDEKATQKLIKSANEMAVKTKFKQKFSVEILEHNNLL